MDLVLGEVEQIELLVGAAAGLWRQLLEESEELGAPLGGEDVAVGIKGQSILGDGRGFFSLVRILEKAIRVRGSSRSSRSSPGGIHTEGKVPLWSKIPRPSASSLSVLWT